MKTNLRTRFWVEAALASLCGILGVVSMAWQDWVEAVTGFDPDAHDGSFEWAIVAGLLLVSVVFSLAARIEWRRARSATPAGG